MCKHIYSNKTTRSRVQFDNLYSRKMRIFEQFKLYDLSSVGAISMGLIFGTFSEKNYLKYPFLSENLLFPVVDSL